MLNPKQKLLLTFFNILDVILAIFLPKMTILYFFGKKIKNYQIKRFFTFLMSNDIFEILATFDQKQLSLSYFSISKHKWLKMLIVLCLL